ncbi:hypothetical protein [Paractinoplanes durhamensis]|uniref:hypothetical protein n=1 Tax=Paractinoplanes durhamensis TaxID=113563 RepID=UPI0036314ED1
MTRWLRALLILLLIPVALPSPAAAAPPSHTVTFDGYSFLVDGQRTYLWAGSSTTSGCPAPASGWTSSRS